MTDNGANKMVHNDARVSPFAAPRSHTMLTEMAEIRKDETNTSFSSIASRQTSTFAPGWKRSASVGSGIESPTMPSPVRAGGLEHHHHKVITVVFVVDGKRLAYKIDLDYYSKSPFSSLRVVNVYLDEERILRKSPRPPADIRYRE